MTMKNKLQILIFTALFAALIAALTFVRLPFPVGNGGYLHLGDSMIYLAACLLPAPCAAVAAAIGGGLADVLGGAAIWAPATIVIKACMALMFSAKRNKIFTGRNALALLPASLINGAGYLLYEGALFGNWAAIAIPSVTGSLIQSGGSAMLFVLLALALDRLKVRRKMWQ
jgi:uncharacterized repeat protein (TIGR04002 family)